MPEFAFDMRLLVTGEDENDAYTQVSDSGLASGALLGTVLILSLDTLERVPDAE